MFFGVLRPLQATKSLDDLVLVIMNNHENQINKAKELV